MKEIQIFLSLFTLLVSANILPPTDGRFFYADYRQGTSKYDSHEQHFVDIMVGTSKKKLSLGINTNLSQIGLFKSSCLGCKVPTFYDPSSSTIAKYVNGPIDNKNYVFDYLTSLMVETTITSNLWVDSFYVQLNKYSREMNFTIDYALGNSASVTFDSDFDGYLGIQPWKANVDMKAYNFMYQLQQAGNITNNILAIYTGFDQGNSSILEFGSWDAKGLAPSADIRFFRCLDDKNFWIKADSFVFDYATFIADSDRYLDINPHLPYLYLPNNDFSMFVNHANKQLAGSNILCDYDDGTCYFHSRCEDLTITDTPLQMRMYDLSQSQLISIPFSDLLYGGSNFGTTDNQCYLGIFRSTAPVADNVWTIGSILAKRYYVVYDASTIDDQREYVQVGLGQKNTAMVISNTQYDNQTAGFNHSSQDQSYSTIPVPKPTPPDPTPPDPTPPGPTPPKPTPPEPTPPAPTPVPPAPTPEKKQSWFVRHWAAVLGGGLLLLIVLIILIWYAFCRKNRGVNRMFSAVGERKGLIIN